MTTLARSSRYPRPAAHSPLRRLSRRGVDLQTQVFALLSLSGLVIMLLVLLLPRYMPYSALMVPLLLGSIFLAPRQVPLFVAVILVELAIALTQVTWSPRTYPSIAIQLLMCLIVVLASVRRSRLGVAGFLGESMFVDLRDRLLNQSGIPELPRGWHVESALRSAGGTPFAGDFLVTTRPEPDRLEVVVVDVSGKGEQAGTRALMLSGAFGGLLGALPPEQFLPAANQYLLQQEWEEGFATAIHLSLDLPTGAYEVRTAGHPPAAHRAAGSGRWSVLHTEGPILGILGEATFTCVRGVLGPGDAVLLYTDGMVEEPRVDIDLGIDRMLGEAETLLRGSFVGSARTLVDALGSRDDDRAMLVATRT